MAVGPQSSDYPLFYKGRGERRPAADVLADRPPAQQEFKLGGAKRVQLSVNVLNLLNQKTATNFSPTVLASGKTLSIDEAVFYQHGLQPFDTLAAGTSKDPRYMMANGYQGAINARVGVKFIF